MAAVGITLSACGRLPGAGGEADGSHRSRKPKSPGKSGADSVHPGMVQFASAAPIWPAPSRSAIKARFGAMSAERLAWATCRGGPLSGPGWRASADLLTTRRRKRRSVLPCRPPDERLPAHARGKPLELSWLDPAQVGRQGTLTRVPTARCRRPGAFRDRRRTLGFRYGGLIIEASEALRECGVSAGRVGPVWLGAKRHWSWSQNDEGESEARRPTLIRLPVIQRDRRSERNLWRS